MCFAIDASGAAIPAHSIPDTTLRSARRIWQVARMARSVPPKPSPPLRFRSEIEINGINPFVAVDAARAAKLKPGWRKPLPVQVRVNGKPDTPWRINMMPRGDGSFYLYLHEQVRSASATKVGDIVDVELRFDADYRAGPSHPMPEWFREALDGNDRAREGWDALPPSRKKEILRYFAQLKLQEAKARNLTQALHVLAGHKARFMARDWNADAEQA